MTDSPINYKGALRNVLDGTKTSSQSKIFELIDNRKHSISKKVFIDIDTHNSNCVFGYDEAASKEQIEAAVIWYNINNEQQNIENIASKGVGLKIFEFTALGNWSHCSKSSDGKYFISEINSKVIYDAYNNSDLPEHKFSQILTAYTSHVKDDDEISRASEDIFNNIDNKFPFKPNTIFRCRNLTDINKILDNKDENGNNDYNELLKSIKIKYYNEINNKDLELYIKLPGYTEFKKIENDIIDVIGFTDYRHKELKIDIFIDKDDVYYFEIEDIYYKYEKNKNEKVVNNNELSMRENPDFSFYQYNIKVMSNDERINSITGKSEERYAGVYIKTGGTFLNSQPTQWDVTKRNFPGNKTYRGVLECVSSDSKKHLKLNAQKSEYNLQNTGEFSGFLKMLNRLYTKYHKGELDNDYILTQKTNNSKNKEGSYAKSKEGSCEGYFYIVKLGVNFYKFGIATNRGRVWDHNNINNCKNDFTDIDYNVVRTMLYHTMIKIKHVKLIEEQTKKFIHESVNICKTYPSQIGTDIREFFSCNNIGEVVNFVDGLANDCVT